MALLRRLGVTTGPGVPDSALDEIAAVPVLGGGRVVGVVRATAAAGLTRPAPGSRRGVLAGRLQKQALFDSLNT